MTIGFLTTWQPEVYSPDIKCSPQICVCLANLFSTFIFSLQAHQETERILAKTALHVDFYTQ